ncbi:Sec7 domain belongs to guanine nucleotide exchange factor [Salix suchowensis]|nr:Sec7 domain belongs to guanine nucleotide exchange factor [Salix suchowensis]
MKLPSENSEGLAATESLEQAGTQGPPRHSDESLAEDRGGDERGRRIDKGTTRVRVVGFDGTNQDGHEDDEYVALGFDVPRDSYSWYRINIFWETESVFKSTASSELASVYEDPSDPNAGLFDSSDQGRFFPGSSYNPTLSVVNSPNFAPSSLPSFGLSGLGRIPSSVGQISQESRTFPRHVRKTSFDHTVSKEGVIAGLGGRHQVNGKPISPDSLIGTKRRAEAPHAESMLRADPPTVKSQSQLQSSREPDHFESTTSFPSSSFNFSFHSYDFLDLNGSMGQPGGSTGEGNYPQSTRTSTVSASSFPMVGSPSQATMAFLLLRRRLSRPG